MSGEMVERLARAYVLASGYNWDRIGEPRRNGERAKACTALMALREPTDAMIGAAVFARLFNPNSDHSNKLIWQAMIDSALEQNTHDAAK